MAFAEKHGIPVPTTKEKPFSTDRNLLHISYEGGVLEDPWNPATDDMYTLSVSPRNAPDKPEEIEIDFECGNPVAVNGEKMSPAKLLKTLNVLGAETVSDASTSWKTGLWA